jgi:1,4-dihydroxy-2-naphthoate octaprenyltransferase
MATSLLAPAPPALSQPQAWIAALRLRTLTAAIMPILAAGAVAFHDGILRPWVLLATLGAALLIQLAVNLANDYYDHVKGVDKPDRMGPARAAGTLLPASRVRAGMILCLGLAALLGTYLITVGGWPILVVGLASLACAIAYAGGPKPLGHLGLGEVFVFAFFGPLASAGTLYLQGDAWRLPGLFVGIPAGALSAAILVVNNVRDIPTDARAGKRTMAVRLGARRSWIEYAFLLALAYAIPLLYFPMHGMRWTMLLPLLTLPMAVLLVREGLRGSGGPALNRLLVRTAGLHAAFGLLFAGGLAV